MLKLDHSFWFHCMRRRVCADAVDAVMIVLAMLFMHWKDVFTFSKDIFDETRTINFETRTMKSRNWNNNLLKQNNILLNLSRITLCVTPNT